MKARLIGVCALLAASLAVAEDTPPPRIAWHGTWDAAKKEAQRSGKPILLVAAAPHCRQVSGLW